MALPEEWQQMVLAQAVQFDVFHDDHIVVTDTEHCSVQKLFRVLPVAAR